MSNLVGITLGRYRLVLRLGRGGMAEVYKAYHSALDRYVAVKVIHSHLADDPDFINRFEREATAVARLRHANIVQVHDFDSEGELYYMVMEFIEGPTLEAELKARAEADQPLSQPEIARIIYDLAQAIDYAHQQAMVHRDLKPGNVMFTASGQTVLTDFGIAQMLGPDRIAETGSITGTPAYMAPEQGQGQPVDGRSDVYSLGVILYELLAGRVPFQGEHAYAVISQHISEPPPPPTQFNPDLDPALEAIILRTIAKDPAERYPTALALAQALQDHLGLNIETLLNTRLNPISIPHRGGLPTTTTASGSARFTTTAPPPSPYQGLFAFQEDDAPYFFGREIFVDRLEKTVRQQSMVAVVGPSGSGKSSVIFAGLLPRLRQQSAWQISQFRPGNRPFLAISRAIVNLKDPHLSEAESQTQANTLADTLRRGDIRLAEVLQNLIELLPAEHRTLLVADQFEELYTLCQDGGTRRLFLRQMFEAVQQINQLPNDDEPPANGASAKTKDQNGDQRRRLLASQTHQPRFILALTLRADFLGQALTSRPFSEVLQFADVKLGPMTRQELSRAVESPASTQNVAFEAGLVERILDDVGEETGNLPLLQFALTLLWDRQRGRRLTHEAYESIGRVEGALAQYADEVYQSLPLEAQWQARRIFTQMVRPGEGTEDTRRVATRTELSPADWDLVQKLADSRLVVTGRDGDGQETVEVVHEALIRGWGLLREWMNADRVFRTWQERLRAALRQWEANERDEGALLRGSPLAEAEAWLTERNSYLTPSERDFIERSLALREREATEREARRQRELDNARQLAEAQTRRAEEQAQATRKLQQRAVLLSGALVVAALLAIAAVIFGRQATQQEAVAMDQQATAVAEANIRATAQVEADSARISAEQAQIRAENERDRADEQATIAIARQLAAQATNLLDRQNDLGLLLSLEANRLNDTPETRGSLLSALQHSPHHYTTLWGHKNVVQDVAFSPDGSLLVTVGGNGQVIMWDMTTLQAVDSQFTGHDPDLLVNAVAFHPSGEIFATASDDGSIRLWDVSTRQAFGSPLRTHSNFVQTLAFSPDGRRMASGSGDQTVILWDSSNLNAITPIGQPLEGHTNTVWYLDFSPDGRQLATASTDGTARVWDVRSRTPITEPLNHEEATWSVDFSPDGQWLAASDSSGQIYIYDAQTFQQVGFTTVADDVGVGRVHFSPDSQRLTAVSANSIMRVWDMSNYAQTEVAQLIGQPFIGHRTFIPVTKFSPDGELIVTGDAAGKIIIWDVGGPQAQPTNWLTEYLGQHPDGVTAAHFLHNTPAPSGEAAFITSSFDGTVRFWDSGTQAPFGPAITHTTTLTPAITGLAFRANPRPDSNLPQLVSGGDNGTLMLWSESSLTTTTPYTGLVAANLNGSVVVAFSPYTLTGTATATRPLVASGGVNGVITLRHGDTGELIDPFFGHTKAINALAFNPNPANQSLASASDDETVRLWWAADDQPRPESLELRGHSAPVLTLAFNAPGNRLASADETGEVIIWRLDSHQIVTRLTPTSPGPILALSFGSNNDRLFALLQNGSLIAWNLSTGQEQTLAQADPATTARFNPAGDRLALVHADGRVSLWQGQTGQALGEIEVEGALPLISLAFEPDTDRLAVGDSAGSIFIFETETLPQNTPAAPLTRLTHAGWSPVGVRNVALSPDERWLATLATDGSVVLWDVPSRTRFGEAVRLGGGTTLALVFSPDGERVAVSTCAERNTLGMCDHTEIVLLETATQQIIWRVQRQVGAIFGLLFTPDGETIISGGCDQLDVGVTCISGSIEFTDAATGEQQRDPIEAHTTQVRYIALSPDGQTLASTSFDQTVRFWDMATLQPRGSRFTKHSSLVTNLVFNPDGQTVASTSCHRNITVGCQQGEFMLWNFRTGQAIGQPVTAHQDWIWGLDFSPDGNSLLTAGLDGQVQAWDIQLDTWRAIACRIANRNMTPEEWQQMLGDLEPYYRTCG